jgi:hypothetical protein
MSKIHIIIFSSLILVLTACKKNSSRAPLPGGSVTIQTINNVDTLVRPLSILKDSTMVIELAAGLSGKISTSSHWVDFAVDTTKIVAYRAQYGNAMLLPSSSYFLYRSMVQLAAGSSLSDSAQINIVQESQLFGDTTYVLPIVIQSVDGTPDGAATDQVVYLVFKTGHPAILSKSGWTIAANSSYNGTFTAANVLDKDDQVTYWVSNIAQQMPQYFTINFNRTVTFSALNYYFPPVLTYPANGGYPTSIQIETSMDGTNWTSNGIFTGNLANNMQTLNTGTATAGYLRFTVLSSVKYAATYSAVFISGIELLP